VPKTHPVSIRCETHGLAGNLVLPHDANQAAPVPGVLFPGAPGPLPQVRYSDEGAKQWPVLWSEAFGAAGLAALCYDQRGGGLSSGVYHEADWNSLLEDARAAADVLRLQPEVSRVAAIAWADGCGFALQLAAEGLVHALVLLAPPYHTAEERYAADIAALAARKGLSDRVVRIRVEQWKAELLATAGRVEQGETTSLTELGGGRTVTVNTARFLQAATFNPAALVPRVSVPALLLHGEDDTAVSPSESAAMAQALPGPCERITYPGVAHFVYRDPRAMADAADWLRRTLAD